MHEVTGEASPDNGVCKIGSFRYIHRCVLTPICRSNGLAHLLNPAEGEAQQESSGDQTWMAYRENGRSYHTWKRGTYPFPCDEVCSVLTSASLDQC